MCVCVCVYKKEREKKERERKREREREREQQQQQHCSTFKINASIKKTDWLHLHEVLQITKPNLYQRSDITNYQGLIQDC